MTKFSVGELYFQLAKCNQRGVGQYWQCMISPLKYRFLPLSPAAQVLQLKMRKMTFKMCRKLRFCSIPSPSTNSISGWCLHLPQLALMKTEAVRELRHYETHSAGLVVVGTDNKEEGLVFCTRRYRHSTVIHRNRIRNSLVVNRVSHQN